MRPNDQWKAHFDNEGMKELGRRFAGLSSLLRMKTMFPVQEGSKWTERGNLCERSGFFGKPRLYIHSTGAWFAGQVLMTVFQERSRQDKSI